jgi:hypothetical protein
MGAGRGIGVLGILMATPVLAAGVLPLDGAYGNESGCHFFATGQPGEEMVLVTPDTALLGATGCDFERATADGELYAVTGICSTPGLPSRTGEILRVRWTDSRVTVYDGLEAVGPLLPCIVIVDEGTEA